MAVAVGLFAAAVFPAHMHAQILASEMATVTQTIDGTTLTLTYFRPHARGRTGLFGTRVHWGDVWTPGANGATKINVSKDITLEGKAVPKGAYSVWIVVEKGPWEMVLDKDTMLFHTQGPKQRPGQIRFPLKREKQPFMEALTWWFPKVTGTGATLAMQWDTVYVPLQLRVEPSYSTAVAADVARRIVGVYELKFEPEPVSSDTTLARGAETAPANVRFTIRQQGNELRGVMDPPMYTTEEGYADWILIPAKGGWFSLGRFHKGELIEILDFFQVQFDPAGASAKSFDIRAPNDFLIAKGTRRN